MDLEDRVKLLKSESKSFKELAENLAATNDLLKSEKKKTEDKFTG